MMTLRITCKNVDEFIENLVGKGVFDNVVYVDRSREALDLSKHCSSFRVNYQSSAVIEFKDVHGEKDGEGLLQCGEDCGIDRESSDGGDEGTQRRDEALGILTRYCESNGLTVKPGILDM